MPCCGVMRTLHSPLKESAASIATATAAGALQSGRPARDPVAASLA